MGKTVSLSLLILFVSLNLYAQRNSSGTIRVTKGAYSGIHVATIGGTFEGKLSNSQLIKEGAITLTPPKYAQIIGFEISFDHHDGMYSTHTSKDSLFTPGMLDVITRQPIGSLLLFRNIKLLLQDSSTMMVNSIAITISKDSISHRKKTYPVLSEFVGSSSGGIVSKSKLQQSKYLKVIPKEDEFKVTAFSMRIVNLGKERVLFSNSNELTPEMKSLIGGLKRGKGLSFENIRAKSSRGVKINAPPLYFLIR
ncbi:MAG: hypothetical protein JKY52_04585 [Flavobacteriales bacterium]|nr:hypothetical protein [Flavobacteriales bacterium]